MMLNILEAIASDMTPVNAPTEAAPKRIFALGTALYRRKRKSQITI